MATKYRVQGPDGAVHVFEGPDDATPAQIESFAAQTFGAAPKISSGIPSARRTGVDQIPGYDKPVPARSTCKKIRRPIARSIDGAY